MIYVSSSCIQGNRICEVIEKYAENGIRNIELSGGTNYYSDIVYDLKKLKKKYDLNYVCHAYFPPPKQHFVVNLASCNEQIYEESIKHYVNCMDILQEIECDKLSIHAGFLVEIGTQEIGKKLKKQVIYDEKEGYDRFCYAYRLLSKECEKKGIELYLENNVLSLLNYNEFGNHNYLMMTDYDSIMRMKKLLDFNFLLDLGHLHVTTKTLGLNYVEQCKRLAPYVDWVHISQNNGVEDQHKELLLKSEITKSLPVVYREEVNITLETITMMEGIKNSYQIVESTIRT